jgi:hypothetical protein
MTVEPTEESILSFTVKRVQEVWDGHQQPYMLARLSPDLAKEGINYKKVLGETRLKDFFRAAANRIKIVTHPTQKAKIGLIPPGENFEFASETSASKPRVDLVSNLIERGRGSRRRVIVSNFLQLLSELDDTEASQVQIPTHILSKLMRDQ